MTTGAPAVNTTTTQFTPSGPPSPASPWLFDSGASHHTVSGIGSLQDFSAYDGPDEIRLGNGSPHG
ncbi:unnamed protein product, partial [Cuscuta epithymum]